MSASRSDAWAVAVILGWLCAAVISISVTSAYKTRIDLETRKDCFASNERIAEKLGTSKDRIGIMSLQSCDWR